MNSYPIHHIKKRKLAQQIHCRRAFDKTLMNEMQMSLLYKSCSCKCWRYSLDNKEYVYVYVLLYVLV